MEKIGLFFGSDTGTTEEIVEKIKDLFSKEIEIHNISNTKKEDIEKYKNLILASPTWGDGDLQSDWEDFEENLENIDFSNKTVALLGIGDQEGYEDTFCNALGHLYGYVKDANIIGQTSTDGYEFEESTAVINDKFIGLVLDEDNQSELTDKRLEDWVKDIENKF
ncbi:flavodoxin [Halarcobacter sp.]|uniref:flavodoxin n=1 Tax=Halarcobacter sp. TaxID=2321133 RepID=UPI002AABDFD9|nr:flavodoxin [Halarcobacter sp.]